MATERERGRSHERFERLGKSSLDRESLQREAIDDLRRVIGFDRWCWPLADPDTLLPLAGIADHDYGPSLPRALELEFSGKDFVAKHLVAREANGAGSLSAETGGDLARSARWDEVMRPVGIGDVAVAACRDALGCWGWIELYRDGGDRAFDEGDLELLASAGSSLGSALRHTSVAGSGGIAESRPTGVIVLNSSLAVVDSTASAQAWIDVLPAAGIFAAWGMLPATAYPVATLARSPETAANAHALEQGVDGSWVMTEASVLDRELGTIAVTFRRATPVETFDPLCRAYALTKREREVVDALVRGLDTEAVTERLFISRHTVQDHLKAVFDKVGVHSRRELLATFSAAR